MNTRCPDRHTLSLLRVASTVKVGRVVPLHFEGDLPSGEAKVVEVRYVDGDAYLQLEILNGPSRGGGRAG